MAVIDNIAEFGTKTIWFTGGEPLLRPDFEQLVKYAYMNGLKIRISTNGTLFSEQTLHAAGKYANWISFSLHGTNAEEDFAVTGLKGGFEKKMRAMRALLDQNVFVAANTIGNEKTISKINSFADFSEKLNVNYWFLNLPDPTPGNKVPLSSRGLELLFEKVLELRENGRKIGVEGAVPLCAHAPEIVRKVMLVGKTENPQCSPTIAPSGKITACSLLEEFLGNAVEDDLAEVWRENAFLKNWNNLGFLPETCQKCGLKEECRGGCRTFAKIYTGTYYGLDPRANPANVL